MSRLCLLPVFRHDRKRLQHAGQPAERTTRRSADLVPATFGRSSRIDVWDATRPAASPPSHSTVSHATWSHAEDVSCHRFSGGRCRPYPQDPDCRPAVDSLWLSNEELATFEQWREDGYEEGSRSDFVRPEPTPPPVVPDPHLVMRIDEGYVADVTRPDDYRCIPIGDPIDRRQLGHEG